MNCNNLKRDLTKNNLFQSDLLINKKEASISNKIAEEVNKALSAFNKLTISNESQFLRKFRTDFYNKYEDEEIPLVMALDVETGIGFGYTEAQKGDVSPLVDGLILPRKQLVTKDLKIDVVQDLLIKKYESFLKDDSCTEVRITEKDLVSLREDWDDLPPTLSSIIEVLRSDDSQYGPLILMRNAVGPSAANLLGRFCFLDKEIKSFVKEITRKEEKLIPQKLFAEIVHLPESRMGNILMRPILRSYEIPYLAKASVGAKKTIPLQDIMISVTQGKRIKLRSRKLGIEIIPRLSSAHNFSNNSLPIYHFLCALQTQGLRNNIGFRWGALLEDKSFLPRVRYNNVVFSPAIWNIVPDDTKQIPKITSKDFYKKILDFKYRLNLPDKALLVQGDNKLLIDFRNLLSTQMLFSEVKNRAFRLEEFLFDDKYPLVKDGKDVFTNQVILSFYKQKIL
jgi:hypothetical protein